MSIVRIGLAETKNFSEGWEAIFGNKKSESPKKGKKAPKAKAATKGARAKKTARKKK